MAKILIVYSTNWNNTKKMAEVVATGARAVKDALVVVKESAEATGEDVQSCDALVLGTPVHMGACDWKIKKFIDDVCSKLWMKDAIKGKVGAVFATGGGFGSAGGGCELAMLSLLNNLVELGLIIIPLPKDTPGYAVGGLQWGPYARSMGINMEQTGVTKEQLQAAEHHGRHIAQAAKILKGSQIFN